MNTNALTETQLIHNSRKSLLTERNYVLVLYFLALLSKGEKTYKGGEDYYKGEKTKRKLSRLQIGKKTKEMRRSLMYGGEHFSI